METPFRVLCAVQGTYFLRTGGLATHQHRIVSGCDRKEDRPSADRVGERSLAGEHGCGAVIAAGATLLTFARQRGALEAVVLGMLSGAGLLCIVVVYVSRRVILPIYLVDAVLEVVLLLAWSVVGFRLMTHRESLLAGRP